MAYVHYPAYYISTPAYLTFSSLPLMDLKMLAWPRPVLFYSCTLVHAYLRISLNTVGFLKCGYIPRLYSILLYFYFCDW